MARPFGVDMLFSVGSLWRGALGCLHMANSFGEVALAIALAILFLWCWQINIEYKIK